MSKRTNNARGIAPAILAAVALIVFGGLIYYVRNGPPADLKQADNSIADSGIEVQFPVATRGGPDATFGTKTTKVPAGTDLVVASVNAFLETLPMVPPEARLRETKRTGTNLELVFTSNFRMSYGTDDESTIVKGIMHAVKANSDVKTVTLTEGGRPIETLGQADLAGEQSVKEWTGG